MVYLQATGTTGACTAVVPGEDFDMTEVAAAAAAAAPAPPQPVGTTADQGREIVYLCDLC